MPAVIKQCVNVSFFVWKWEFFFFFSVELLMIRISEGEGNGTPLQYSCLENPMDGGAW